MKNTDMLYWFETMNAIKNQSDFNYNFFTYFTLSSVSANI